MRSVLGALHAFVVKNPVHLRTSPPSVFKRALTLAIGAALVSAALSAALVCTWRPFAPVVSRAQARFGVAVSTAYGTIDKFSTDDLNIGWYYDYHYQVSPSRPNGADYVQVVRTYPLDWNRLALAVLSNRGSLWLIGNEPENRFQDARTPSEYAAIYHDLYRFIKRLDPNARLGIGAVTQPTPLRLAWLDQVLASYQSVYGAPIAVDVWNIHVHISREQRGSWGCDIPVGLDATEGELYDVQDADNLDLFASHIIAFRTWMRDHGEQHKPLLVSEFGVLQPEQLGFLPDRVIAFMHRACDFMLTATDPDLGYAPDGFRLVQRWAWFSLNEPPWDSATGLGFNGGLLDHETGALTAIGREYVMAAKNAGLP